MTQRGTSGDEQFSVSNTGGNATNASTTGANASAMNPTGTSYNATGSTGGSQSTLDQAKDKASQLADQASEKAAPLVDQAKQQGGQLLDQARDQVTTRLASQKDRAAEGLGGVAQALRQTGQQMREGDQSGMTQYVDQAAEQVERLSGYIQNKDLGEVVDDVERFARRQPGLFLGGAFVLGLLGARFLKSSRPSGYQSGGYPLARRPSYTDTYRSGYTGSTSYGQGYEGGTGAAYRSGATGTGATYRSGGAGTAGTSYTGTTGTTGTTGYTGSTAGTTGATMGDVTTGGITTGNRGSSNTSRRTGGTEDV
jgi:hypothetical protein